VIDLNIHFRLDKTSYDAKEYFTSIYYTFLITASIAVEGRKYVKQYECRYYLELQPTVCDGWENAVVQDNKKIIYHKPGLRGMIGTSNKQYEPLILKKLFDYMETLQSIILEEEEKNKPIITDISFKKRDYKDRIPDLDYEVIFTLKDGKTYTTIFSNYKHDEFELLTTQRKLPNGKEKKFPQPTYYFYDHIYEQIFNLLMFYSSERIRLVHTRKKRYVKHTFIPSQYPLETVKITIQ